MVERLKLNLDIAMERNHMLISNLVRGFFPDDRSPSTIFELVERVTRLGLLRPVIINIID